MRGRSSTWTRIRVNLEHVPEDLRPVQEALDPDSGPRSWGPPDAEWTGARSAAARTKPARTEQASTEPATTEPARSKRVRRSPRKPKES